MNEDLVYMFATLSIIFLIFLIIRAIVLWYWRVNEGIALLKSIDEKLDRLKFMDEKLALIANEAMKT